MGREGAAAGGEGGVGKVVAGIFGEGGGEGAGGGGLALMRRGRVGDRGGLGERRGEGRIVEEEGRGEEDEGFLCAHCWNMGLTLGIRAAC